MVPNTLWDIVGVFQFCPVIVVLIASPGVPRYAMDVRILVNQEVAILDGACSLLGVERSRDDGQKRPLHSIPHLDEHVDTAIAALRQEHFQVTGPTALYGIGSGLRCTENLARMALRRLHELILESLLELSS